MDKLQMQSKNLVDENIEFIAKRFPNCVTEALDEEGKLTKLVDFDMLKQELSHVVIDGDKERYTMTWPDKKQAILTANAPIAKTLRPCREESVDRNGRKIITDKNGNKKTIDLDGSIHELEEFKFDSDNLYIEGDNLDVLKLLRETYLGKIKMIYIDPPYNTGNDFVYNDDFAVDTDEYLERSNQIDDQGNRMVANNDSNGRFHTDWLNMIYPRLKLAKDLLTDDGGIFVSIDDSELINMKKVLDEIFGERNFVARFVRKSGISPRLDAKFISTEDDAILFYAKEINLLKVNKKKMENDDSYNLVDDHFETRGKYKLNKLDRGSISYSQSMDYPIIAPDGSEIYPGGIKEYNGWCWRWSKEKLEWGIKNDFIVIKRGGNGQWAVYFKQYQCVDNNNNQIERRLPYKNLMTDGFFNENATKELLELLDGCYFDYPKPVNLLKVLTNILTAKDSIIVDFFSGSATTAHAVMQLNADDGGERKFIMVQLPEKCDEKSEAYKAGYKTICEISKERIRRAGKQIVENLKHCGEERKIKGKTLISAGSGPSHRYVDFRDDITGEIYSESRDARDPKDKYKYNPEELDIGFRCLKLDSSCMKDIYYFPNKTTQDLLTQFEDNIKEDRTGEDLLFQVMLEMGVELSTKIIIKRMALVNGKYDFIDDKQLNKLGEKEKQQLKTIFVVGDNSDGDQPDLVCCFDKDLNDDVVTAIAKMQPLYAVFRDAGMSTDSVAVNFDQIFETYSPTTTRKII